MKYLYRREEVEHLAEAFGALPPNMNSFLEKKYDVTVANVATVAEIANSSPASVLHTVLGVVGEWWHSGSG